MKKVITKLLLFFLVFLLFFIGQEKTHASVPTDPEAFYSFLLNDPRLTVYSLVKWQDALFC